MPTVSIILPTYNRTRWLKPAIDSVFAQTFGDWELVIGDDGSTEETRASLRGLESRKTKILWLSHSGNPSRVLPPGVRARLERGSWTPPPIFGYLAERGEVAWEEMERTFNLGVGFLFVWSSEVEVAAVDLLRGQGEAPWRIGTIEAGGERAVDWR